MGRLRARGHQRGTPSGRGPRGISHLLEASRCVGVSATVGQPKWTLGIWNRLLLEVAASVHPVSFFRRHFSCRPRQFYCSLSMATTNSSVLKSPTSALPPQALCTLLGAPESHPCSVPIYPSNALLSRGTLGTQCPSGLPLTKWLMPLTPNGHETPHPGVLPNFSIC